MRFGKADSSGRKTLLCLVLLAGWLVFMAWAQRGQTQLHRLHAAQRATVTDMGQHRDIPASTVHSIMCWMKDD